MHIQIDWTREGKPFDAGLAALLAHAAFESYNDPAGGKWEVHQVCVYVCICLSVCLSASLSRSLYDVYV